MMDYLRGDREELQVITEIDGETRGFFNEREIAHMEDVKSLFLGGLSLRRICLLICAAALILLYKLKRLKVLPASILMGTGIFFAAVCLLSLIVASDFQRSFTIFHQIFFDNDLWILNPNTDLLVNIVPEQFFHRHGTVYRADFRRGYSGSLFDRSIFLLSNQEGRILPEAAPVRPSGNQRNDAQDKQYAGNPHHRRDIFDLTGDDF